MNNSFTNLTLCKEGTT